MALEVKQEQPQKRLGDSRFVGVDMRQEAQNVPDGFVAAAINKRFRKGVAEDRKGSTKPPWLNYVSGGSVYPWNTIYGMGEFRDPIKKQRYAIIASSRGVFAAFPNNAPFELTLPDGVSVTDKVTFKHGTNVVVMLRGEDLTPLVMTNLDTGFIESTKVYSWSVLGDYSSGQFKLEAHNFAPGDLVRFTGRPLPAGVTAGTNYYIYDVPDPDHFTVSAEPEYTTKLEYTTNGSLVEVQPVDGSVTMPNALYGFFAANRLFVINGDIIYASDPLDYTRHVIWNEFRVHQGGGEALMHASLFGDSTVIALKERSVLKVSGVYGDLGARRQSVVTTRYGCVAPETATDVGTDFVWLSQDGVASLKLTEFGEVQASQGAAAGKPEMFSAAIQPLIDRINWNHASNAVAAVWDEKLYIAVPLDGAEVERKEEMIAVFWGGDTTYTLEVIQGAEYKFRFGDIVVRLENGADNILPENQQAGYFTAAGSTVTLVQQSPAEDDTTIKRVFRNVNNAVLVYDFTNGAWSGYDEYTGLDIKNFFKFHANGRERLFFYTTDGYVFMVEEAYEDQLAVPYLDLHIATLPTPAHTLAVNGGTTISVADQAANGGNVLGCDTLANAQANIWGEQASYGYNPDVANPRWTSPDATVQAVDDATYGTGVRFYSTNGLLPTIVFGGTYDWWIVREATTQPVISSVTTRGYTRPEGDWQRSQWLGLDAETWWPSTTYTMLTEGVEESTTLASARTKSRTAYYRPFDATPYTVTNANDDALTAYREDYSVQIGAEEAATVALGSGVKLGLHQHCREQFHLTHRGSKTVQLQIDNSQGRHRLTGVVFEATAKALSAGATG